MESTLPSKLICKSGPVDSSAFTGAKVKALYFSASWCAPCKTFAPTIAKFYEEINKYGTSPKRLELLYVSGDEDEEDFKEFSQDMPWPSIPFEDDKTKERLNDEFKVVGIPFIVLVDEKLQTVKSGVQIDIRSTDVKNYETLFSSWTALYK